MFKKVVMSKNIPLLVAALVPERSSPTLSIFTSSKCRAIVRIGGGGGLITKGTMPSSVRRALEDTYNVLVREVLTEPLSVGVNVEVEGSCTGSLGLASVLVFFVVEALARYYEEEFTVEEETGILASLFVEAELLPKSAAASLANTLVLGKPTLYSEAEGPIHVEAPPVNCVVEKELELGSPEETPSCLLDALAKLSSVLVVEIATSLSRGEKPPNSVTKAFNSIWHILYDAPPQLGGRIIVPDLYGKALVVLLGERGEEP